METLKHSVVIPVFKNEASIEALLSHLDDLSRQLEALEVVFVVDGSPDRSFAKLKEALPAARFSSQLVLLTRNFGSFAAVNAGLAVARGEYFAVIAADLQEPPELAIQFFRELETGACDIVVGQRLHRDDPVLSKFASALFWGLYRRLVQKELPPGGIDVFACNRKVRDTLVSFSEANTSLVGLLLWVGFRRRSIGYQRLRRQHGKSAWSFRRKYRYLKDSVFAFSDLPIQLLGWIGTIGIIAALCLGVILLILKFTNQIEVPGYVATVTVILFFGGLNAFGLSLLGEYIWRNFENSKQRPRFIVLETHKFSSLKEEASELTA